MNYGVCFFFWKILPSGQFLCSWICSPLKKYLLVRSHELLPRKCGNWSFSSQNESELSPRSIQSYFPHLQGPSCRKSPSTFFRSKWVKYDYSRPSDGKNVFFDPIGDCNQSYKTQLDLKSADHDFLQMGPWRRGKQFWIDLGESSDSF